VQMEAKSLVPQITGSFLSAEELLTSQEGMFSLEFVRWCLVGWLVSYSVNSGPEKYICHRRSHPRSLTKMPCGNMK
jgi:hypothetical protein